MKRLLLLFLFISCMPAAFAQFEKWEIHQAYQNTEQVEETNNHVFALADSSLYIYGKEDQNVITYSRKNGLSDNKIKVIRYHASSHTLVIAYRNGNIDLLGDEGLYNLPCLKNSTSIQNKTLNDIYFYQDYAYLSSESGIVVIHVKKKEITDTYKIGAVRSTCILNGYLYALTDKGIKRGKTDSNLLDIGNWSDYNLETDLFKMENVSKIGEFKNALCFFIAKDGIYYQTKQQTKRLFHDTALSCMKIENDRLLACSSSKLYVATDLGNTQTIALNGVTLKDASCLKSPDSFWLACGTDGLKGIQKQSGQYAISVEGISINSPKRNYAWDLKFNDGKLWVTGGGRWLDRYGRRNTIMTYANGQWTNYDEQKIAKQANAYYIQDAMNIAIDSKDPNHIYVAYYGEGILELKNDTLIKWYNLGNSGLETSISNNNRYVRIGSVTLDKNNNLWVTNCEVPGTIKVLTAEGKWYSYPITEIANAPIVDKILITQKGYKFVNFQHTDRPGIFAFNDNGTIDDTTDDVAKYYPSVNDSQGASLAASRFFSLTEDKNGNIWAGTNIGPLVCYNPNNIEDLRFNRPVLGDESDYLLNGVRVNAIAVDGSNQKWIGTEGSGIFLVNSDGTEVLENFTTDNSPLPINSVNSIAVHPKTGEVFFAVDGYGLLSYKGEATEGNEDYSDIHAYPNPVRPDYDDKVTITGLMSHSNVKITDISGNLVYQTKSTGGQISWNCKNAKGERVATGVYLVIAATEKAKESVVTKIMVIK